MFAVVASVSAYRERESERRERERENEREKLVSHAVHVNE